MAKFVTNKQLLVEIRLSHANREAHPDAPAGSWVTHQLASYYVLMVNKYSVSPNWSGYTFLEDMKSTALLSLISSGLKFDPNKSSQPFCYFTTIIYHSFLKVLSLEKKQSEVLDKKMVDMGLVPSWGYQDKCKKEAGKT